MHAQYTLTLFTPGEAEKITGLSTTMQRDWRRRGFLPEVEGHARFDAFGLAEMWAVKLLSDRGIGPQATRDIAPWCGAGIMWHALKWGEAYEGDHLRTFDWDPPECRPKTPAVDAKILETIRKAAEGAGVADRVFDDTKTFWGAQATWLAKQIFKLRGYPRVIPAPYFIWWADGTHVFHDSLEKAFSEFSDEPKYAGPVLILDLHALASTMLDRAGRALVHVEFPTNPETGEIEQPIQYGAPVINARFRGKDDE